MNASQDGGVGEKSDDDDERHELSEERREQLEVDEKTHRLPVSISWYYEQNMLNMHVMLLYSLVSIWRLVVLWPIWSETLSNLKQKTTIWGTKYPCRPILTTEYIAW